MITLNYFISLNEKHLIKEHEEHLEKCEEDGKTPMNFEEFCIDKFESLDCSDEAYEEFKDK